MAGLKLIFFTATIAVLIHLDPVHGGKLLLHESHAIYHQFWLMWCFSAPSAVCSGPGLIPNPCVVGGGFCRLFPQAVCNVVDCEARYFVGKTDVTNHCEIGEFQQTMCEFLH